MPLKTLQKKDTLDYRCRRSMAIPGNAIVPGSKQPPPAHFILLAGTTVFLVHQTHGEAETSGRLSVLVSPPEYSTIHRYKV